MSIEMTDAMRRGLHRPAPEPCWCTGGKVSARCKIHSQQPIAAPSAPASAPVDPNPTDAPFATCGEVGGARKKRTSNVRKGGKMPNQTEARMLAICEARKRAGEIDSYRYEGLTLRWGRDQKTGQAMNYTPDVVVVIEASYTDDTEIRTITWKEFTLIECKGAHIYERDLVRFKGCRAEWPEYNFEMWRYKKGTWEKVL